MNTVSHPVLSGAEARDLEARLFGGDETKEWPAMQRAGRAIAAAVLRDFEEIGGFPADGRVLVLAGKGHNGGDALIAAQAILEKFPRAKADVILVFGERLRRPLAVRAWREFSKAAGGRAAIVREIAGEPTHPGAARHPSPEGISEAASAAEVPSREGCPKGGVCCYDLCLDGVFGFQFRPPAEPRVAKLLARVNALPIRLRAAVDLPSAGLFRADFTYATGSVKSPALDLATAGRVRYLDLGFFDVVAGVADPGPGSASPATNRVLTSAVLAPLGALRAPQSDKRTYGHVFVVAGSRSYPGAALMTVLAALRSGAGLVTAFVPESLVPAFAARAPEAMWIGWPETPDGGLALEGQHLLRARLDRASALVIGPGLGREPETLALVADAVKSSAVPLVLDADALQPNIVRAGKAPRVLTPHAGEFERIAVETLPNATLVLKGPVTRVCGSAVLQPASGTAKRGLKHRATPGVVYHSFFGGPVLARGGSGDVLAGLIGGLLAQTPKEPLLAAARGVVWHGLAADALARAHGQTAVTTTQLLDFLPAVLREL